MASSSLPISSNKPVCSQFENLKPSHTTIRKGLLGLSVVFAAISMASPLRAVGSMGLRSASTLSTLSQCTERWSKNSILERANNCAKVAIVGLGLAWAVLSRPSLVIASLASDIALNTLAAGKAILNKDCGKAVLHFSVIAIETCALMANVLGSWQLMAVAAAVNSAVLLGVTLTSKSEFDSGCYAALTLLSWVNLFTICEFSHKVDRSVHYKITNKNEDNMIFKDADGNEIASAKPGETVEFDVSVENTHRYDLVIPSDKFIIHKKFYEIRGYVIDKAGEVISKKTYSSNTIQSDTIIVKAAMTAKDFHSVPLLGTGVVKI